MKSSLLMTVALLAGSLPAAIVHVRESVSVDGTIVATTERTVRTGDRYVTGAAPEVEGAIFAQWTIGTAQPIEARDAWGRSLESAAFTVYEDTEVVAIYLGENEDSDGDGVPDASEIYWYGDLAQDADSDTDSDGVGFLDELKQGRSPLFADEADYGRILVYSRDDVLYNPNGYAPYVIRSEPENALFPTRRVYASPGECVTTEAFSPKGSGFAYWTVNDERAADAWGVSSETVSFVASDKVYTECVAHVLEDELSRNAYYWYGRPCAAGSDVDGDGYTFAEELTRGLSPVFADEVDSGRVMDFRSSEVLYNPFGYVPYTIRSEPEGALFATINDWRLPGTEVATPQFDPVTSTFAYWKQNGERQQDDWGVAVDAITFTAQSNELALVAVAEHDPWKRLSLYWYGDDGHGAESDADGDGYTFREELEKGLSPVFADETDSGRVLALDSDGVEVSLQDYEQVQGVIVNGEYVDLFASGLAGKAGETFFGGAAIQPVVTDVNGDGLWDIVVCYEGGAQVFVNVGGKGNPEFRAGTDAEARAIQDETLAMNSTEKLSTMTLDVDPIGALSATVWGETLLVSDGEGRIWYYKGIVDGTFSTSGETTLPLWTLQHKVWGGSYAGFAQVLRIAAVDWDDDGDLDCLCGTAEGKLMLLRDPKVGRPTNLKAETGVDNVLLTWDPNAQSRIRGYRVYRNESAPFAEGVGGTVGDAIAESQLPRYRDYPPKVTDFDYRVTSVSRHYVAGNSTPIVSESMPTEAVRVELGKVKLTWSDAAGFDNEELRVPLNIENSLNVAGEGLIVQITYDPTKLKPVRVEPSGLTEKVTFTDHAEDGVWTVRAAGGEIAAGGGTFFTFVFEPLCAAETSVNVVSAAMKSVGGATIPVVLPSEGAGAKIVISPFVEPEPAHATVSLTESVQVTAGKSFDVVVSVAGEEIDSTTLAYEFEYDDVLFTRQGHSFTAADVTEVKIATITLKNVTVKDLNGADAVIDACGLCTVAVAPRSGGDIGSGGDEDDPDTGIVIGDDGTIVDWGDEPQPGDDAYRFGFRVVNMNLGSVMGKTGETVEVPVGIHAVGLLLDTTVNVKRWAFSVRYDERLVSPVGIVAKTGEYEWSATNGLLTVVGRDGALPLGRILSPWQHPLSLKFQLREQYAEHLAALTFKAVQARTTNGKRIYTPIRDAGSVYIQFARPKNDPTVVVPYGKWDMNGDGRLTWEDRQLMAQLMQGGPNKKYTAEQLRAGDDNCNGVLDNHDYQQMKADFDELGIKNNEEVL